MNECNLINNDDGDQTTATTTQSPSVSLDATTKSTTERTKSSTHTTTTTLNTTSEPISTTTNASVVSVKFFDEVFTKSNKTSNVTCCHRIDNSPRNVLCGKGDSCAGGCAALEASLCPSGSCSDDPRTCDLDLNAIEAQSQNVGSSPVTSSLSDLKWCENSGHQCRVRKHQLCCYNPNCLNEAKWPGRKDACAWLNYLTGKKCPFPGSLPHGSWTCETQEVPIQVVHSCTIFLCCLDGEI